MLSRYAVPLVAALLAGLPIYVTFFWNNRNAQHSDASAFSFGCFYLLFFCYISSLFQPPLAYVPSFLLLVLFFRSVFRNKRIDRKPTRLSRKLLSGATICIYVIFIGSFIDFLASEYKETPRSGIHLEVPLRHGEYLVFKGGVSPEFNHHKSVSDQEWALDIGKAHGISELKGFIDRKPRRFAVFGHPVYAPCDGKVSGRVDTFKDLAVGDTDREHPFGNHITLDCDHQNGKSLRVRLAHLQSGSVKVGLGQRVNTSTVMAQVGNSGNTSFPHLHIDVNVLEGGQLSAAPIRFRGNFYRAFDTISAND